MSPSAIAFVLLTLTTGTVAVLAHLLIRRVLIASIIASLLASLLFNGVLYYLRGAALPWMILIPSTILFAFLITLIIGVPIRVARSRRVPPGYCQACGYDLTGNESGYCSECGAQAWLDAKGWPDDEKR